MATGRPSVLTTERIAKIADLIRAGNTKETAARCAGVSPAIFYQWQARGRLEADRLANNSRLKPRKNELLFLELVEAVEQAVAECEARLVLQWSKAAGDAKNWRAAQELLKARYRQTWGKSDTGDTGDLGMLARLMADYIGEDE